MYDKGSNDITNIETNLVSAFGSADRAFENNVYRTLDRLETGNARRVRKIGFKAAIALAAAVIMISTTVLAATNTWGIMSFLSSRTQASMPEGAADVIQTNIPQQGGDIVLIEADNEGEPAQTGDVSFKVREAVFDGVDVYAVVEVKASNDDILLLGVDSMPQYPIQELGPRFANETGTIAEYALANGKTMARMSMGDRGMIFDTFDFVTEEDGTLVYMLKGRYMEAAPELGIQLRCLVLPVIEVDDGYGIDEPRIQETELAFTLERTGQSAVAVSTEAQVYAECGVRIDKITLTSGTMSIGTKIEYTVVDPVKYSKTDSGIWFHFLDENGEHLPMDPNGGGGAYAVDDAGTQFVQEGSFAAGEMPDKVIVQAYNFMGDGKFETHTFEIK